MISVQCQCHSSCFKWRVCWFLLKQSLGLPGTADNRVDCCCCFQVAERSLEDPQGCCCCCLPQKVTWRRWNRLPSQETTQHIPPEKKGGEAGTSLTQTYGIWESAQGVQKKKGIHPTSPIIAMKTPENRSFSTVRVFASAPMVLHSQEMADL